MFQNSLVNKVWRNYIFDVKKKFNIRKKLILTVTFELFNAFLLNKSINSINSLTPNF